LAAIRGEITMAQVLEDRYTGAKSFDESRL